jgi:SLOG cluster2
VFAARARIRAGDLTLCAQHLKRLLTSLAGAILREGWRVGYGGDLRRDGFTRSLLADMGAAYARGDVNNESQAPIVHFFACSSWRDMSPEAILNHLMDKELARGDAPIAETRFFLPVQGPTTQLYDDRPPYIAVVVQDGKLRRPDADRQANMNSPRDSDSINSGSNPGPPASDLRFMASGP